MNEWSDRAFHGYLESLAYRQSCCCPGCGRHPEIQGHAADCLPHRWLPDFGYCINEITGLVIAVDWDVVDANRAEDRLREEDGVRHPRYDFEEALKARTTQQQRPTPHIQPAKPSTGALAGILRKVANTPEGKRNPMLYWAGCRLAENNYPAEAWDALADAARYAGLPDREIWSTLCSAGMPGMRVAS